MSIDSGLVGDSILSRAAYGGDGYGFGRGRGGANFEFDGSVVNAKLESNKEANMWDKADKLISTFMTSNWRNASVTPLFN
jgi:hypothetical protein